MARDNGVLVTHDPNYRPNLWPNEETARRVMFEAFQCAHMAKISQEEFAVATGQDDLQAGIRAVLDQGVQLLIVSRGERGALATNADWLVESPAIDDITVIETTRAGDGFKAAMITRVLPEFEKHGGSLLPVDKQTVQDALDYANVVAGLTCTKAGAIPALPTANEVNRYLAMRQGLKESSHSTNLGVEELARMIDHTMLRPHCVQPNDMDIEKLCREARHYGFAMVAVNPAQVDTCCRLLQGTAVRVGAAIGFPLGQTTTSAVKAYETRDALERGATEIDMVLNVRQLQCGNYSAVRAEIETVNQICREFGVKNGVKTICKIILETFYITQEQKVKVCEICRDARVDFVKTSTGFGPAGATTEDVKLM